MAKLFITILCRYLGHDLVPVEMKLTRNVRTKIYGKCTRCNILTMDFKSGH